MEIPNNRFAQIIKDKSDLELRNIIENHGDYQ